MGVMKRVAVYCRSTGTEGDALACQSGGCLDAVKSSPELQLKEIYGVFEADGCLQNSRPNFHRMLRDCENGEIDIVMVNSISRLHRDSREAVKCIRHLMDLGVRVVCRGNGIDTGDAMSVLLLDVLNELACREEPA